MEGCAVMDAACSSKKSKKGIAFQINLTSNHGPKGALKDGCFKRISWLTYMHRRFGMLRKVCDFQISQGVATKHPKKMKRTHKETSRGTKRKIFL